MEKTEKKKREKPVYGLWRCVAWMLGIAWRNRRGVIAGVLALAGTMVASSLAELYIAPAVLSGIEQKLPAPVLLGLIGAFALALALFGALRAYLDQACGIGRIDLRMKVLYMISDKYNVTSLPNIDNQRFIKLMRTSQSSTNSNNSACEAVWTTVTNLLRDVIGFVIYLALLSAIDPVLLAITLAASVGSYLVTNRLNGWGYRHREEETGYTNRLGYVIRNSMNRTLAKDVRFFGMRDWLIGVYAATSRLYRTFLSRGARVYFVGDLVNVLASFLRNGAAYIYLIGMTLASGLPASEFLLYFTAIGGFTSWVTGILGGFSELRRQCLELSGVRELIEFPEIYKFEDGEPLNIDPDGEYSLELRNVTFRYPGAESDTLKNLSLTIRPGEKLAVVGLNGAGKTTLIRLICGYYDPTAGEVLLNGENIKKYNRRDYYLCFSAVFQQFSIIETSFAENIAQTCENIDEERVRDCAERAGIAEKIESLPEKYASHVGREIYEDGTELSGGETQRLMLARALYKNAPVILLDEPTAALDPIAESDMYNKYNELTRGRTSVYISHRLASTRFCDRIILLENGEITEEGTHDELLARGGSYAGLFGVQSRYYGREAVVNA